MFPCVHFIPNVHICEVSIQIFMYYIIMQADPTQRYSCSPTELLKSVFNDFVLSTPLNVSTVSPFYTMALTEHAQECTAESSHLRDTCSVNCFHKGMCKGSLKKIPSLPEDSRTLLWKQAKYCKPNLHTSEDGLQPFVSLGSCLGSVASDPETRCIWLVTLRQGKVSLKMYGSLKM